MITFEDFAALLDGMTPDQLLLVYRFMVNIRNRAAGDFGEGV